MLKKFDIKNHFIKFILKNKKVIQGKLIIGESFFQKQSATLGTFGNAGTFGDIVTKINLRKCVELRIPTNATKLQLEKSDFRNSVLETFDSSFECF